MRPALVSKLRATSITAKMPVHHLMVGTWTPPGAIFTFAFDDEALTLKLVKRTEIPKDEPISWMTFSVRSLLTLQDVNSHCTPA